MAEDKKVKDQEVEANEVKASEEKKETKTTNSKSQKKDKKVKVRILCHNAAGKYNLPYSKFRIAELPEKQAKEMIDNEDATDDLKKHQSK